MQRTRLARRARCQQTKGHKNNMTTMRAKLRIESVTKTTYSEKLKFNAVYGGDKNSEDNTYSQATPSASLEIDITNEALHGKFQPGQAFYVDFTPAE